MLLGGLLKGRVALPVIVGHIADQDFGQPIDFSHYTIDLPVLWAADRDVGQGSAAPSRSI
jgi:hypothetical protein